MRPRNGSVDPSPPAVTIPHVNRRQTLLLSLPALPALLAALLTAAGLAGSAQAAPAPTGLTAKTAVGRSIPLATALVGSQPLRTGITPRLASHSYDPIALATGVAAKAADEALPTITALTRQQDAALSAVMRDPNKLRHIFGKPQHNLGPLTKELGGQEALIREAVLAVPRGTTGAFEVTTRLGRYDLTVRGRVVNGVPRIGTVFVP